MENRKEGRGRRKEEERWREGEEEKRKGGRRGKGEGVKGDGKGKCRGKDMEGGREERDEWRERGMRERKTKRGKRRVVKGSGELARRERPDMVNRGRRSHVRGESRGGNRRKDLVYNAPHITLLVDFANFGNGRLRGEAACVPRHSSPCCFFFYH